MSGKSQELPKIGRDLTAMAMRSFSIDFDRNAKRKCENSFDTEFQIH